MEDGKTKFTRVERWVAAVLAVFIATGLWQGYASWLFGGTHAG